MGPGLRRDDRMETYIRVLAAHSRPSFAWSIALLETGGRREGRVAAAPGALAQKKMRKRESTGTGGYTPALPAQWFYDL